MLYGSCLCFCFCFLGIILQLPSVKGTGNGDLRLVDGGSHYGRVEIYYDGEWGTVCDDMWDINDAEVVCRQLGLGPAVSANGGAYLREGVGPIYLDDVMCSGYEERLEHCPHDGLNVHNCGHHEDARVECLPGFYPTTTRHWAVDGSVRLRDGALPNEGRVEVHYGGAWSTVCDDDWDLNDANVVCQQLGYSYAEEAPAFAHFGEGSGNILLDDLYCTGYENSLLECPRSNRLYSHDCHHSEDAGVVCSSEIDLDIPTTIDRTVRLAGTQSPNEGRVEIYMFNSWGTICDDHWDHDDAAVVCRQLGYRSVETFISDNVHGGAGPILRRIDCRGHETNWMDCDHADWDTILCDHGEDVSVVCDDSAPDGIIREGSVRLMDSLFENAGRVEIFHLGTWGTVCDDSWGLNDALVVCNQLGYPGAMNPAHHSTSYGEGEGSILLDDVSCTGTEHYLADCRHNGWFNHNCHHGEDVGVRCKTPEQYHPRLVNGTKWYEGRVEVWNNRRWEEVCAYNFHHHEALTVCKQLGFSGVDEIYTTEKFGNSFEYVSSVFFTCGDYDVDLSSCIQYDRGSDYCKASAITCEYDEPRSRAFIFVVIVGVLVVGSIVGVTCCVFIAAKQTSARNRRFNSRGNRQQHTLGGGQITSTRPQPTTYTITQPYGSSEAPPSYLESHWNPAFTYNDVSHAPQQFHQGTGMNAGSCATSSFPLPSNPDFPDVSPPSVVHALPPISQRNVH